MSELEVELTPKQQAFVQQYLLDLNGTKAAIRAGYSSHTAASQASDLLRNPKVAEAVQVGMDERAAKLEVTGQMLLEELDRAALKDPDATYTVEDLVLIERGLKRASSFKWEHKLKALELSGKHRRLFTEKVEHEHQVSIRVIDPYAEDKE